jgi:hypothetical protein
MVFFTAANAELDCVRFTCRPEWVETGSERSLLLRAPSRQFVCHRQSKAQVCQPPPGGQSFYRRRRRLRCQHNAAAACYQNIKLAYFIRAPWMSRKDAMFFRYLIGCPVIGDVRLDGGRHYVGWSVAARHHVLASVCAAR